DYEKYAHPPGEGTVSETGQQIQRLAEQQKLIISIDRLDYSKGIPQRLKAFANFLERHPEYHGKVTLAMVVVPSRANVSQYKALKQEIDNLVGSLNGQYSGFGWVPVQYF
ncbi:trehalose-6-phosphate synthase, partial [Arthrospira platensis SPKY1]|nr:trehalose-6-phosphate synthase [Arthrospira platensis SPKY1]